MFIAAPLVRAATAFAIGVGIERTAKAVENGGTDLPNPELKPPPPKPSGSGNALLFSMAKKVVSKELPTQLISFASTLSIIDQKTNGPPRSHRDTGGNVSKLSGTGNERLRQLAGRIHPPKTNDSSVKQAATVQIKNRINVAHKSTKLMQKPGSALRETERAGKHLMRDFSVVYGAMKVASGKVSITVGDGVRVVKADVTETVNETINDLKNLNFGAAAKSVYRGAVKSADASYAAATTTNEGVQEVATAIDKRVKLEGRLAATGIAISQATATIAGLVPHPGFKIAAAAISVTGSMAFGAKLSESIRDIGGDEKSTNRAATEEITTILAEKSGLPKRFL